MGVWCGGAKATLVRCAGPCVGDFVLSGGVCGGMSHAHVGLCGSLYSEGIRGCDVGSIGGLFVVEEGFTSVSVDNGGTRVACAGLGVGIVAITVDAGGCVISVC